MYIWYTQYTRHLCRLRIAWVKEKGNCLIALTSKTLLTERERESNCLEEVLTSSIALIELMLQDDSNSYIVVIVIVIVIYLRILMPQNVFFFSSAPLCGNNLPWVAVSPGYHLWFCH